LVAESMWVIGVLVHVDRQYRKIPRQRDGWVGGAHWLISLPSQRQPRSADQPAPVLPNDFGERDMNRGRQRFLTEHEKSRLQPLAS